MTILSRSPAWPTRWLYRGLRASGGLRVNEVAVLERDTLADRGALAKLPSTHRLVVLTPELVRNLAEVNPRLDGVLASFFAMPHHLGVAMLHEDRVEGMLWVSRGRVEYCYAWGLPITLPESLALIQCEQIDARHSVAGIRQHLYAFALRQLASRGVHCLVSLFPYEDFVTRQLHRQAGFHTVGSVWRWYDDDVCTVQSRDVKQLGIRFHLPAHDDEATAPAGLMPLAAASY